MHQTLRNHLSNQPGQFSLLHVLSTLYTCLVKTINLNTYFHKMLKTTSNLWLAFGIFRMVELNHFEKTHNLRRPI